MKIYTGDIIVTKNLAIKISAKTKIRNPRMWRIYFTDRTSSMAIIMEDFLTRRQIRNIIHHGRKPQKTELAKLMLRFN